MFKNNHVCSYCNKEFNTKQNLDVHNNSCKSKSSCIINKLEEELSKTKEELNKVSSKLFKRNIENKNLIDSISCLKENYENLLKRL